MLVGSVILIERYATNSRRYLRKKRIVAPDALFARRKFPARADPFQSTQKIEMSVPALLVDCDQVGSVRQHSRRKEGWDLHL